jgi:dTDP-4-amino-4,6-dideoxygalactose transaminase
MTDWREPYARSFAEFIGTTHAFPFWKGRVALYGLLKALGVGAGDEVIVPGYTCVMNVNPIFYLGAKPIYADIEAVTYNLDPAYLPDLITPRTKVIIAQHTYGFPAKLDDILSQASRRGIHVLEDCCLALGSTHHGRIVGSYGVAAYFSFQWSKPYTTGLGGMAVTSDASLAARLAELCRTEMIPPRAWETVRLSMQLLARDLLLFPRLAAPAAAVFRWLSAKGLLVGSSDAGEFTPIMSNGFFKGMSKVQRRRGLRLLRAVERNLAHRRLLAKRYDEWLPDRRPLMADVPREAAPVLVRYPIRVADKQAALDAARRRGIELGSWFESPLHPKETPLESYGYRRGQCPVAERACAEVVNLPLHPRVSEAVARRTAEFIRRLAPPKEGKGDDLHPLTKSGPQP